MDGGPRGRRVGTDGTGRLGADYRLGGGGAVDVAALGLDGNDALSMSVERLWWFLDYRAVLDGGAGRDRAFVSPSVDVLNCEDVSYLR